MPTSNLHQDPNQLLQRIPHATSLLGLVSNLDQGCLVEDDVMLVQGLDQLLHMLRPVEKGGKHMCGLWGASIHA